MRWIPALLLLLVLARPAAARDRFLVALDPGPSLESTERVNGLIPAQVAREVATLAAAALSRRAEISTLVIGGRRFERMSARERGEAARRAGADLYIRFRASAEASPSGIGTFSPDAEGRHDGVRGPDRDVRNRARLAAVAVAAQMREAVRGRLPSLGARGESATWVGRAYGAPLEAIHSGVPTLLVTLGALGDPVDAAYFRSFERRDTIARAVAEGAIRYHEFLKRRRGLELRDEMIEYYPIY